MYFFIGSISLKNYFIKEDSDVSLIFYFFSLKLVNSLQKFAEMLISSFDLNDSYDLM